MYDNICAYDLYVRDMYWVIWAGLLPLLYIECRIDVGILAAGGCDVQEIYCVMVTYVGSYQLLILWREGNA